MTTSLRGNGRSRAESSRLESVKEEFAIAMFGSSSSPRKGPTQSPIVPPPMKGSANLASHGSGSLGSLERNARSKSRHMDWHKEVLSAMQSGRWEHLKGAITLYGSTTEANQSTTHKKKGFWRRLHKLKEDKDAVAQDHNSLLVVDQEGRTPLHAALASRKTPQEVLLALIRAEPKACQALTNKKRYPLHFAVLGRHHIQVVAELVKHFPDALSALDQKGQSPLAYAFAAAKKASRLEKAPKAFWMTPDQATSGMNSGSTHSLGSNRDGSNHSSTSARRRRYSQSADHHYAWQQEQLQRWGVVHWLLLSLATNPQTHLFVDENQKPMLVDALLHAAPPPVISLLIGASARLLGTDRNNRATVFAGSTLYSCLARHYPLTILQSLASLCPNDVRTVRDETGMGLVSAHYISACFHQSRVGEWKVNMPFVDKLVEATERQQLPSDSTGFREWWAKMEYLILFCGCNEQDYNILANSKEYLLHAALANPDVPPAIVRLLMALYPSSIYHAHPVSGALPIHIAAACPDYIPRNYEFQVLGSETTALGLVIQADPSAVHERQDGRLPLHLAVDVGKYFRSIQELLQESMSHLNVKDPVTGLLPFMHVSAYQVSSCDRFRWSCLARNKYSHAVWKGLSEKQKTMAIARVAEMEKVERTDSIYRLLRIYPSAIPTPRRAELVFQDPGSIVRKHFFAWFFDECGDGIWRPNSNRTRAFHHALAEANESNSLDEIQIDKAREFRRWWHKMKFWIRYCVPQDSSNAYRSIPLQDSDEYLLHAALANAKNTPPAVIELLLALHPNSAQLLINEYHLLPLHIVCSEEPYVALPFEDSYVSPVELVLRMYPAAACVASSKGIYPLHMAIRSSKSASDLIVLASFSEHVLEVRDENSQLLPFQMAAAQSRRSVEHQQELLNATSYFNKTTCEWEELPTKIRATKALKVQKRFERMHLTCIFELLRKRASIFNKMTLDERIRQNYPLSEDLAYSEGGRSCDESPADHGCEDNLEEEDSFYSSSESSASSECYDSSELEETSSRRDDHEEDDDNDDDADDDDDEMESEGTDEHDKDDCDDDGTSDSEAERINEGISFPPTAQPSSLMRLLSRDNMKHRAGMTNEVLDCDHSVFSGVDVMSSISKSYHSTTKKNNTQRSTRTTSKQQYEPDPEEMSLQISELGRPPTSARNDASVSVAEDSDQEGVEKMYASVQSWADENYEMMHNASDESSSEFLVDSDSDVDGSDSDDSDIEGLVYFQLRRPKSKIQKADEPIKDVRLTKKDEPERKAPGRARSLPIAKMPSRADSLRRMLITDNADRKPSSARNLLEKIGEHHDEETHSLRAENGMSARDNSRAFSLRSHSNSKDFEMEESLGKSFANMRLSAATKSKLPQSCAPLHTNLELRQVSRVDSSADQHSIQSFFEAELSPPSQGHINNYIQAKQQSHPVSQGPTKHPEIFPSKSTMSDNGEESESSVMTGSVSTIQLLECSRSHHDSTSIVSSSFHEIYEHRLVSQPNEGDSSSDESEAHFMVQSIRSHMRTGHGTEESTDHFSRTEHTFSESGQSFFDESTSSGCNLIENVKAVGAASLPPTFLQSDGSIDSARSIDSAIDQINRQTAQTNEDLSVSETPEIQTESRTTASVGTAAISKDMADDEHSQLVLSSWQEKEAATFDKQSFKWVASEHCESGDDIMTAVSERYTVGPRTGSKEKIDSQRAEVRSVFARDRVSHHAFKSLKQVVGLPKAEKDAASWLREQMASESSGMTCLLCNQRQREVLLIPCHHLSLCWSCSEENPCIPCPLCNISSTGRVEIQMQRV